MISADARCIIFVGFQGRESTNAEIVAVRRHLQECPVCEQWAKAGAAKEHISVREKYQADRRIERAEADPEA
jgi:hypothetical protein